MRKRALLAALLAATTTLVPSCVGAPGEPTSASSEPIIGGAVDTTDTGIVAVVQPAAGVLCSGTLVAPSVVLTAAHCAYLVEASALQVLVGTDRTNPDQTIAVSGVAVYPTYTGEETGLTGGVDLAVVYLATPLSITPVAVNTTATDAELSGADVTLVGYGVSSTTDTSQVGIRRDVSTTVSTVCSRLLTLGSAEANECSGDSGGAVLLGGALVAVISSGNLDCTAPSNQTRLSAHSLWLESVLYGDAGAACPECVPPDPSCTAATETEPAGYGQDAGEDAGTEDAGESPAPPAAVAKKGGCAVAQGGEGSPADVCLVAGALALLMSRSRRRRDRAVLRPPP